MIADSAVRRKPTIASSDAAAEAQGSAEEHLPIPKYALLLPYVRQ